MVIYRRIRCFKYTEFLASLSALSLPAWLLCAFIQSSCSRLQRPQRVMLSSLMVCPTTCDFTLFLARDFSAAFKSEKIMMTLSSSSRCCLTSIIASHIASTQLDILLCNQVAL